MIIRRGWTIICFNFRNLLFQYFHDSQLADPEKSCFFKTFNHPLQKDMELLYRRIKNKSGTCQAFNS
jgi:hypothetical protein